MKKLICTLALFAAMTPFTPAFASQPSAPAAASSLQVPANVVQEVQYRRPPPRRMVRCRDGAVRRAAGQCRRHGGVRRYR